MASAFFRSAWVALARAYASYWSSTCVWNLCVTLIRCPPVFLRSPFLPSPFPAAPQNLVRQIKADNCPYDYVEVMACPSGCMNGGGQLRATGLAGQRQLLQKLDQMYQALPVCSSSQSSA